MQSAYKAAFLVAVAIGLALISIVPTSNAASPRAPACTSVSWGSPENYSVAGAARALLKVENLLSTVPGGTSLEGAALIDAKALLHEAGDHAEQITNRFALVTTPGPACWRCSPFDGTPNLYAVSQWLSRTSDRVYGPAHGITGGDRGIMETIESWGNLPPCTLEQIAAVDGRAPVAQIEAEYCRMIPGLWSWFINGDVTFKEDGTLVQGSLTGRWTCNNKDRRVNIVWSHGFTDAMTLSTDGGRLSGRNNTGHEVSGTKKAAAPPANPSSGQASGLWWYVVCGGDTMRTPMGPPSGDTWMGNYQLADGTPGWIFELRRGGEGWSGTGFRFNDRAKQRHACSAMERPDG